MSGMDAATVRRNNKIDLGPEMEETLKRIKESSNVVGVVLVNGDGMPIKSSLDSTLTVQV